jgi:hypothetical protein
MRAPWIGRAAALIVAAGLQTHNSANANEVIRTQFKGPKASCEDWLAARKSQTSRLLELQAFVRGYAEGVHAHINQDPSESRGFSFDGLYQKIDAYCDSYADSLQAATEVVLEQQWPSAGDQLKKPGVERPAPKSSYTKGPPLSP